MLKKLRCFVICCVLAPSTALYGQSDRATCETCHSEEARQFSESVHTRAHMGCRNCHGGAESYTVTPQDVAADTFAHGETFTGAPTRFEIPDKCAVCHSNVAQMNPYGLPADQLDRYKTSGHGKALFEEHNADAAVCTDCHNVHAIYSSNNPKSGTNPINVPDTCGRCHANVALMSKYGHHAELVMEYRNSVHGKGLLEQGDTGMPTCATCHGNHAAAPPGVADVNAVCGRCHMQTERNFLESPHAAFPMFPRCLGCHGGQYGHAIERLTANPTLLAARFANLSDTLKGESLIDAMHPGLSVLHETCYECHDEDSDEDADLDAFKRSAALYDLISSAEIEYARTYNRVNKLAEGVLLVEDEQLLLSEAKTAVIELGPVQHTLDVAKVRDVVDQLRETTHQVQSSLDQKEADLQWRYWILWPMWIFIFVFATASYVRYRQLKHEYVKPLP